MEPNRAELVEEVKEKYGLQDLREIKYDKDTLIFFFQTRLHEIPLKYDLGNSRTGRNFFASGLRNLQSLARSRIDSADDIEVLGEQWEEYDNLIDGSEETIKLYEISDLLNQILDGTSLRSYLALEGDKGGIISEMIRRRIIPHNRNYILGIFAPPGSGKSFAGMRIATNVSGPGGFDDKDIVYTTEEYYDRVDYRDRKKIIKGSTQIIDEGGNVADAMTWMEETVQGVVRVLRTQRFHNTLTIIITPEIKDIVTRARGLFHGILIPKTNLTNTDKGYGLTEADNIDDKRKISSWRFLSFDIDPITGKIYKKNIRVAGGVVRKVEITLPPQELIEQYEKKSQKYKRAVRHREKEVAQQKRLNNATESDIEKTADEIIKHADDYRGERSRISSSAIEVKFGVGGRVAQKIKYKVLQKLKEKDGPKD